MTEPLWQPMINDLVGNPKGQWQPPKAGNAPKEVKAILRKVYTAYRDKHSEETQATKTRGAKIAWAAVRRAGLRKDKAGKWARNSTVGNVDAGMMENVENDPYFAISFVVTNEQSYEEFLDEVRYAFYKAHPTEYDPSTGRPLNYCYVIGVFDGYLVYCEETMTTSSGMTSYGSNTYRQSYSVEKGKVVVDGTSEEVKRTTSYEPVSNCADSLVWQSLI